MDRDRTTITDRVAAGHRDDARVTESTRRYVRNAPDTETVTVRHPDRTVEVRTQRRADSDSSVASSSRDRVWDRANPNGPRETTRTRDTNNDRETPRARADDRQPTRSREVDRPRETPRETVRESPREVPRFREPTPSGEPPRSADRSA